MEDQRNAVSIVHNSIRSKSYGCSWSCYFLCWVILSDTIWRTSSSIGLEFDSSAATDLECAKKVPNMALCESSDRFDEAKFAAFPALS